MPEPVRVEDNPPEHRFQVFVDEALAGFADYRDALGQRELFHTFVDPRFEGRGLGGRLAAAALDDARAKGLRVVPTCPFVHGYIERHPEYADLLRKA